MRLAYLIPIISLSIIILISGCVQQSQTITTTTQEMIISETTVVTTTINLDKKRNNPYPSLNFNIDCSHLDNQYQDDCQTFVNNQENIVYPELKRITGIDLKWSYDKVSYAIYPTKQELVCSEGAGGCAFPDGSIAYLPEYSINTECELDVHELQHIFDYCINQEHEIMEGMISPIEITAYKTICPSSYEFYLKDTKRIIDYFEQNPTQIKDCQTAQIYVILNETYTSGESFLHKFYEWLLQKDLGIQKTETDITEAIYYASNKKTIYYISNYCVGEITLLDTACKDGVVNIIFSNIKEIDLTNLCEFSIDEKKINNVTFDLNKNQFALYGGNLSGEHPININCYGDLMKVLVSC